MSNLTDAINLALKYTIADEIDFHRQLRQQPDSPVSHLGYADWLREQGREGESDLIAHAAQSGGVLSNPKDYSIHTHQVRVTPTGSTYSVKLTHPLTNGQVGTTSWEVNGLSKDDALHHLRKLNGDGVTLVGEHANKLLRDDNAAQVGLDDFKLSDFSSPVNETPSSREMKVNFSVKYKAVPEHDVHPDYQPSGIAPRVGNLLNQIAQENSGAGNMAQGILMTGDHSLLKFLGDKLADDGHELRSHTDGGTGPDWRHVERGMKLDRAAQSTLTGTPDVSRLFSRPATGTNATPLGVIKNWTDGKRGPISRTALVKALRKTVPDASREDAHHALLRLGHLNDAQYLPDHVQGHQLSNWIKELDNQYLKGLNSEVPDPHLYPDTRPVDKRNYAFSEKYAAFKSPAGGMVVKDSPLAVVGTFRTGGTFTNLPDPEQPVVEKPKPKLKLADLLRRVRRKR